MELTPSIKMMSTFTGRMALNITNGTGMPRPDGPNLQTDINIANIVICLVALVLNLLEVFLIVRKKQLKAFDRILLSLCTADIFVVLLYLTEKLYEHIHNEPIYGYELDNLFRLPLDVFAVMSSITNIIILGIDRLVAVKYPLKHVVWMTSRKIGIMIAAAWVGGIVLSLLSNINRLANPQDKSPTAELTAGIVFGSLVFSSGFIISIIYVVIVKEVVQRSKHLKRLKETSGTVKDTRRTEITITVTCVLVVLAFSICSYPFAGALMTGNVKSSIPFKTVLLNSLLDPLVYFFKGYLQNRLKKSARRAAHDAAKGTEMSEKANAT